MLGLRVKNNYDNFDPIERLRDLKNDLSMRFEKEKSDEAMIFTH